MMLADLRFALRMFARNPGTTAVAVLSLALAIGPNSALFSVIDHFFLRPSAVEGAAQLYNLMGRTSQHAEALSYPEYRDYIAGAGAIADLIAENRGGAILTAAGRSEMVPVAMVSENYFTVFRARAYRGRMIEESDARWSGAPPIVLSYAFWQRRFGGDPDLVGKSVLLNGTAFSVAGVAPRGFRGPQFQLMPMDAWIPASTVPLLGRGMTDLLSRREAHYFNVMARLHPGIPRARAEVAFATVAAQLARQYPATNRDKTSLLLPSEDAGRTLFALVVLSLVGLVLLIACANIAGVLLAQGEARRREFAVRLALGAGRGRLVRQWIAESLLLATTAAVLGVTLSGWLLSAISSLQTPLPFALDFDFHVDGRVLGYTALLALVTAIAAGMAPALQASRPDLVPALKGDSGGSRGRFRFRSALVVMQIALSQFLLAGAGLLLRSYLEMQQIRPGFDPDRNVLVATVTPSRSDARVDPAQVLENLRAIPGVRRVTSSRNLPLSGMGDGSQKVLAPGAPEGGLDVGSNRVGADYFGLTGTRILRGRDFRESDPGDAAAVNEAMARRIWGSADAAIGKPFRIGETTYRVASVVETGKYRLLTEDPLPFVFLKARSLEGTLLIETATAPAHFAPSVRKLLVKVAPDLLILGVDTLREHMWLALFAPKAAAGLVGTVALLGIFLAGVGLYGLVGHSVNRRAHEIGVRMAMGARPRDVLALVLRGGLGLVAIGASIGVACAVLAARVVSAFLFHVSPFDPAGLLGGVAVVAAVALLAAHIPAHRATRVDPMTVLRSE